ncbi:MAG: 16S rRNA (cytidine(1402)-2'-O)-methyltransferase [Holophagales bacterium]|jgi:16S rRNA (cytidine1402-2'-O)-methyltransferase|nr:16S rRNA (cytidine(1402)-2'-O)-methyltransferase [Holophagales bacterium]
MAGRLILVPTPLGNLGDITARAVDALASCDLVACEDTRRTGALLKRLNIDKPMRRFDDHAGAKEAHVIASALMSGKVICYCSDAGMPGINDPGFELVRLARESGAEATALPGPSVVTLAVVGSGLPTHAFSFLGYIPARQETRRAFIRKLAAREETSVVFETPHRITEALKDIAEIMPERELALGRELTKLHEAWYRGTPCQVLALLGTEPKGELVLVIAGADAKRVINDAGHSQGYHEQCGPDSLPDWAGRFLDAAREGGMTLREAVKPLAKRLGLPPSDLYKMASDSVSASKLRSLLPTQLSKSKPRNTVLIWKRK